MKISIIIPCYNEETYILNVLEKVNAQKNNFNLEIIITDDCSTDGTISILEKNKSKKLQYSIAAYMSKMNKLEIYDKDLQEEVNNLKNRKPEVIIKTKIEYVHDTIFMSNILLLKFF